MTPCLCNEPKKKRCQDVAVFGIVPGDPPRQCELFAREAAQERTLSLLMDGGDE